MFKINYRLHHRCMKPLLAFQSARGMPASLANILAWAFRSPCDMGGGCWRLRIFFNHWIKHLSTTGYFESRILLVFLADLGSMPEWLFNISAAFLFQSLKVEVAMLNSHDSLAADSPFFIRLMISALNSIEYALLARLLLHIVLCLSTVNCSLVHSKMINGAKILQNLYP